MGQKRNESLRVVISLPRKLWFWALIMDTTPHASALFAPPGFIKSYSEFIGWLLICSSLVFTFWFAEEVLLPHAKDTAEGKS